MKLRKLLKMIYKGTAITLFDADTGKIFHSHAGDDNENVSSYLNYKVTSVGSDNESIVITLRQSDNNQDVEEDKITFVKELGESLHKCADRAGIEKLRYVRDQSNEFVLVTFDNGLQKKICVTGDSCLAIMNDIYKILR